MLRPLIAAGAVMLLSGCAYVQTTEIGYPRGALAREAIEARDWKTAEALLDDAEASGDPAKLLNLAAVYRSTGRFAEAQAVYRQVLNLPDARDILLLNKTVVSSHDLARKEIARVQFASR